jgi:hypothetical protein
MLLRSAVMARPPELRVETGSLDKQLGGRMVRFTQRQAVHNCAERLVQPGHGADALQRPRRSRFRQRHMPSVDMTSGVRS